MTNTAFDLKPRTLLSELLDEQFSQDSLQQLLGEAGTNVPWATWEASLYGPLAEFLQRPGKEFRGRLVDAGWRIGGGRGHAPDELVAIVEVLHAGSLVVDDIEDGSAYRRGGPALHVTVGVPKALNMGCWLYFWTDALLHRLDLHPTTELGLRRAIARTLLRAHQGQALDLAVKVHDLAQKDVPGVVSSITQLKTGALMQLAAELGVIAARGRPELVSAAGRFGRELGVGLQMADDWGGIVSEARCHKGHEDLLLARATWPWAWLAESSDEVSYAKLAALGREVELCDTHPELLAERLRELLDDAARAKIRGQLRGSLTDLSRLIEGSSVLNDLKGEIETLEKSYG